MSDNERQIRTGRSTRTIGLAELLGEDRTDESEFRDFMAHLFATAATMQALRRRAAKAFGLSSSELAVLIAVSKMDSRPSVRKIADHLQVAAPNVTADVNTLVANDLVRKRPDPEDARALIIELTRNGRGLIKKAAPALQAVNDVVFAGLTHQDMRRLSRMLERIATQGRWLLEQDR